MTGTKLIEIMRKAGKTPDDERTALVFGVVTGVSPLKIKIDNRFEVDETFLLLSRSVKEYKVKEPSPLKLEKPDLIRDYILWRDLEKGDKVILLRLNNGQLFYVLERVGDGQ